jgi:hypothetical protein
MTFAAIANLISGQRPFYLYRFARSGEETLFTSLPYDLTRTVAGVTGTLWRGENVTIAHGKIPNTTENYRAEFPITLPASDPLARSFLAPIGIARTSLTIWKGFLNDTDAELIVQYRGRVAAARPSDSGTITLSCLSEISALSRKGLAAVIQRPCRHVHYGDGCRLTLADWQVAGSVSAITTNGLQVTVAAASAQPDGYYRGGILQYGDGLEMILAHTGSTLRLAARVPGMVEDFPSLGALPVTIAPGCNLTRQTCLEKFDNIDNFGGFPWIADTPFDGRSIV